MNLKEHLRQIAINKIKKTQISSTNVQKSKSRVAKKSNKDEKIEKNASQKPSSFFVEIPVGHFGYVRPAEARYPTEAVRELTKKFQEEFLKRESERKKRILSRKNHLKSRKQ